MHAPDALAGEPGRRPPDARAAEPGAQLVVDPVGHVRDGCCRNARLVQAGEPISGVALAKPSRDDLDERIRRRTEAWLAAGWIDEVNSLSDRGYAEARAMASVGYRQVRDHLRGVAAMAFLPPPLRTLAGPFNLFATTGFLPAEFRSHMQLPWSAGQQRRFEWLLIALRLADRVIPREVWVFGYELYLRDLRARARRGKRVV